MPMQSLLRFPTLLLALTTALSCAGRPAADAASPDDALRVMTFNVRYGTASDGEDAWPHRRAQLLRVVADHDPAVLGLQEALKFQVDEIRDVMDEPGALVGVGRDDGVEAGEYSAILYDRGRLSLLDQGTFWLSDTPTVPSSTSWGNRIPRIATWARFRDAATDLSFYVLNTHWDHESQNARERSAAAIMDWIADHAAGQPVLVMGDFNAGEENPAFTALVGARAERRGVRLRDTFRAVHPDAGEVGTYHGFRGERTGEKIDGILASPGWEVLEAAIVRTNDGGRYPSDHFPVTATVLWAGGRE